MSHRLAQIFLRKAFPGGRALGASAMKATDRTLGERLAPPWLRRSSTLTQGNLAHAYSLGYDPWAGLRQQAFLRTAELN